ncbi:hypothetical protein DVH29_05070 [Pelagibacterium lacus]|uniref:Nucleotidyltransferase family protein n=1 Tax=Pelagibacterium lacus TaxID=2282655 RepID=A0A369W4B2_9HYPH|nr:hypothetical protein DVH29_05070 [Pelagibacterium lacus]
MQAVSHRGAPAVAAYKAWRALGSLDAADHKHHRAMPLLAEVAAREGIADPDLARMRGVARHFWAGNAARLDPLDKALAALATAQVTPLLLSSAAAMVRDPGLAKRRVIASLELLVAEDQFPDACRALAAQGFVSQTGLILGPGESTMAAGPHGLRFSIAGRHGDIVLRTSVLASITDTALADRLRAASTVALRAGHKVRLPSCAHQVFCALAHNALWDGMACFTRLLEGEALLAMVPQAIEWTEVTALAKRYGVEAFALAYLDILARNTPHAVPATVLAALADAVTAAGQDEWRRCTVRPRARAPWVVRRLFAQDLRHERHAQPMAPATVLERAARRLLPATFALQLIGLLAQQRVRGQAIDRLTIAEHHLLGGGAGQMLVVLLPLRSARTAVVSLTLRALAPGAVLHCALHGGGKTVRCDLAGDAALPVEIPAYPLRTARNLGMILVHLGPTRPA